MDTPKKEIKDFSTITVTQTYSGYSPFVFNFHRIFKKETRDARQHYFGLTQEEKREQETSHRTFVLASQLKAVPTGLDEIGYVDSGNIAKDFQEFITSLGDEDFINSLYIEWQDKAYPKELLSDTSS